MPDGASSSDAQLTALSKATNTRWAAATTGSQSAASLELASGTSVLAVGGFSGGDPSPTLAEFRAYVASGQVRYYVASGDAAKIASWVRAHYRSTTVGVTTVYDLTEAK
jgi:hypothetical protein